MKDGFILRPARWDDLAAVAAITELEAKRFNDPLISSSVEELQAAWQEPGYNLETDACVVEAPNGLIVGYEEYSEDKPNQDVVLDGYVHPDYCGLGIGTAMLHWAKNRLLKDSESIPNSETVTLRVHISIDETAADVLLRAEGFQPTRYFWKMKTHLELAPPVPVIPAGFNLIPFNPDTHMQAIHAAHEEAFSDHWGYTPHTLESFVHRHTVQREFDPNLWFLLWDADQIAGYALCRFQDEEGWVGSLGVRRPWRKQGLGLYLLKQAFAAFYERQMPLVGLTVDSDSLTGATRLYEKAGMQKDKTYAQYALVLREAK